MQARVPHSALREITQTIYSVRVDEWLLGAQHMRFTATGSEAMWLGAVSICTDRAVMVPPSPAGPMPVAFTASSMRCSSCAVVFDVAV